MNYYIDTEFLEGPHKEKFPISLFRKETKPTIDLISIGIVSEDGREYYAISKDFNLKEAWNRFDLKDDYDVNGDLVKNIKKVYWIRENDLKQILDEKHESSDKGKFYLKLHNDYPKQENEHNALADARWNKKLHEFLNKI